MIFRNDWNFGGEIVRIKDFGNNNGGNVMIRGITTNGCSIEMSIFLSNFLYKKLVAHDDLKYQKINVNGHFEFRVHETSGLNIKKNLKLVADNFQWVS